MDYIPLYPYATDPLRILSPRRIQQELPAAPPEPPPDPPPPAEPPSRESIDDPPKAASPPRPGAGTEIPDAAYWERRPARSVVGPPPRGEGDHL